MVYENYGKDYDIPSFVSLYQGDKMKKYYLSLICVGVIVGSIGAAVGLSYMTSKNKKTDNANNVQSAVEQNNGSLAAADNTEPPELPEKTPEPLRIKPSTKMIYEYFYQADNRTVVNDQAPPYFLLDQPQDKIKDYYPDWDIVEFDESRVKLRRTIPAQSDDHYVLGVKDNYVAVYQKTNTGSVSLKEVTATPISSLSIDEQNKLISGITVQNDNQLAKMLEDYGS